MDPDTIVLLNLNGDEDDLITKAKLVSDMCSENEEKINVMLKVSEKALKFMMHKNPKRYQESKKRFDCVVKQLIEDDKLFNRPIDRFTFHELFHKFSDYVQFVQSKQFYNLSHSTVYDIYLLIEKNDDDNDKIYDCVLLASIVCFMLCQPLLNTNRQLQKIVSNIGNIYQEVQKKELPKKLEEAKDKAIQKKEKKAQRDKKLDNIITFTDKAGIRHKFIKKK